jgi:hypothetical protein
MIQSDVAWTLELWLEIRGEVIPHHLAIDRDITMKQLRAQFPDFPRSYGRFGPPLHLDESGD